MIIEISRKKSENCVLGLKKQRRKSMEKSLKFIFMENLLKKQWQFVGVV
jgi:hypothetical protein